MLGCKLGLREQAHRRTSWQSVPLSFSRCCVTSSGTCTWQRLLGTGLEVRSRACAVPGMLPAFLQKEKKTCANAQCVSLSTPWARSAQGSPGTLAAWDASSRVPSSRYI